MGAHFNQLDSVRVLIRDRKIVRFQKIVSTSCSSAHLITYLWTTLGIYLVSFFSCMRVLLWSEGGFKPMHLVNKKMLVAALLMFLFASLDVAFHLRHNLEAFIWFDGDPIEDFDKTSSWINVISMGFYVAQTFVGDSILVRPFSPMLSGCILVSSAAIPMLDCV